MRPVTYSIITPNYSLLDKTIDNGTQPEGKGPLGRPMLRWDDNIKMDLHEVGCEGMDWIDVAHVRESSRPLLNAVMNLGLP
jgi:hypothetical protein